MSLPPQVIHVKRKRTEEGPVPSFLKIESAIKRHRSDAFLYRRHDPEAAALLAAKRAAAEAEASGSLLGPRSARPPRIHASQPGDEKRKKNAPPTPTKPKLTTTTAPNTELEPSPAVPSPRPIAEPRRFHLSRHSLMAAHAAAGLGAGSIPLPGMGVAAGLAGVRKRARYAAGGQNPTEPAVFVERSKRKHRTRTHKKGESGSGSGSVSGLGKTVVDDKVILPAAASDSSAPGATLAPLPKRPGRRLATKASNLSTFTSDGNADVTDPSSGEASAETDASTTTTSAPALPPSLSHRQWNTDMEQLTRDMNDYTLEIIGRNLAQMEVTARTSDAQRESDRKRGEMSRQANERRKAAYAKYKPKPGMRYSERQATSQEEDDEAMGEEKQDGEEDDDMGSGSETDEDDYVTETYVRIPGHEAAKAQAQAASEGGDGLVPATIGLLVFDNEPDLEFFYGVEEDSEEEFEDDEDENAENYYTHDYPEDEVSSDDEFDRDAYHYRNGNASDLEEFEENSDGEGQGDGSFGIGVPLSARLTKPGDL
ncbi:hypothetical protein F503_05348 [Ophiostoma piceae UAMH 11346]|uniref:Transcription factor Iwr1 domain-containing protein n=1 Tax=Ophiostoma piceae (strain UAMH 11346) TaxID=1262450 RepID=S3CU71_OPHP1|nr:hypothetical protein F503_05348 [Ophiostoma piceae UAMH 11346]